MFALEHSKARYWSDYLRYGVIVGSLALCMFFIAPAAHRAAMLALGLTGLAAWSLVEYGTHRFVLHALEPFKSWPPGTMSGPRR